jgi:GT2 family glycosyltransferase/glycosyltransferase involved in cell wall biosynthesis
MRILLVVHGFPPSAAGGTEIYTHDLAQALAATTSDEVFVLTREADAGRPEYSVRVEQRDQMSVRYINNTFRQCTSFEDSYANPPLLRVAASVISEIRPDVAHVQHLTCLSIGIPEVLARAGIPVVLTLNDYWMLCHRGQLLDLDGNRCDGPLDRGCARCVPAASLSGPTSFRIGRLLRSAPVPGADAAARFLRAAVESASVDESTRPAVVERVARMHDAARHVRLFLVPSQTIADRFASFGIEPDRLLRCTQGIDLTRFERVSRTASRTLRLGFAGSLIPSKAPHVLLEAAAMMSVESVIVDVIGSATPYHGDDRYLQALGPLLTQSFVRRTGPLPHDMMAEWFGTIDVLVVPSIWIENAPFVIREAFAARVPVLASDLGGMAEMVVHERNGLLFPPGDARALAAQLHRLRNEPDLIDRLRGHIVQPTSIQDDAIALRGMYERLTGTERRRSLATPASSPTHASAGYSCPVARRGRSISSIAAVVLNYNTPDQTWLAVRSLQTSFATPGRIIVVDNGSSDGSAAALRSSLGNVDVLETHRNLGFSGGCNVGIAAALARGAEQILLVNSDVVLAPDALGALFAAASRDRTAGVLAPLILARAEPGSIASGGISYSRWTGRMRHLAVGQSVAAVARGQVLELDAVSGCVMLIRRAVLETAGPLKEDYFFSFEDIELCFRARAAGFRTVCVTDAWAYHEGCRSIGGRSPRRVYFATRNHLKLATDVAPTTAPLRALRGGFILALNLAYVLVSPDAPLLPGLAALVRGTWHHLSGRYGPD